MSNGHFLWTEKYRPHTVEDTILPQDIKEIFQQFVDQGNIPHLLMTGGPGIGKTTVAKAMLDQLDCDYIVINGSMNGNIDTLRNEILNFASAVSLSGGRKYVIIDEADYLNQQSTQPALRNFMEEFAKNCGFIFTCNYPNRIIKELHSRCTVIDFKITKKDVTKLASQFFKRVLTILDKEGVKVEDPKVVAAIINKHFPDCRRILNQLQTYSSLGSINAGILVNMEEVSIKELIDLIKEKNYTSTRKWVSDHLDSNVNEVFRKIYDTSKDHVKPQFIPALVVLIGKYQYQAAFAVDQEINLMAFLAEVMIEGIYQ